MKNKKKYLIILSIIGAILLAYIYILPYYTFKLKGKDTVIVELNKPYKEPGTNQKKVTVSGKVDTNKAGNYILTYTYKNQQLTRTVKVVDPSRVIFSYKGSSTAIVKKDDPYIESGCTVYDKVDGYISDKVKTTGTVDTSKVGQYTVTYSVTNSAGYTLKKNRVVNVVDENQYAWASSFPVLMYHYVYSENHIPANLNNNFILDTHLEEQLQYLKNEDYYFASYAELSAFIEGKISLPEKSMIISFDDGAKRFLRYGIPVLEKYAIPATSFLIGIQDGENKIKEYINPLITFESHSYNMHRGGGTIGHGGVISSLSASEIKQDLEKSIAIVSNNDAFAYPFGDVTKTAKEAIKEEGFKVAFTTENRQCLVGDDLYQLPRVRINGGYTLEKFIEVINE